MTTQQNALLATMIDDLRDKGWQDDRLARVIRNAANGPLIAPPPVAEAELAEFLRSYGLPG